MKKINIKYLFFSLGLIIIIFIGIHIYRIKTAKLIIVLKDDLDVNVYDRVKISSLIKNINGNIINDSYIDTSKLGKKKITVNYINDDRIRLDYSFYINIVDKTLPIVWLDSNYNVKVNSEDTLKDNILCGDNYDDEPKCSIIGSYDLNTVGSYALQYKAIDKSGNETIKEFYLNVYSDKLNNNKETNTFTGINYSDVYSKYKSKNTKIGLDISKWQGNVDFSKLKKNKVEFVFIRVGGTRGKNGKYFIDEQFIRNIKQAKKYNIPVGIYFHSYATSIEKAREDASWVIKHIKKYDIKLPIAYDFEDWTDFNSYNVSFYKLTNIAYSFMSTIEKSGYDSLLYGSKNYLEQIWMNDKYNVWLAHYTTKTDYKDKYKYWQLTESGTVDGIEGFVDIDVMYK